MLLDHAAFADYRTSYRLLNQMLVNDNAHLPFHLRNAKKPLARVMFGTALSNRADSLHTGVSAINVVLT